MPQPTAGRAQAHALDRRRHGDILARITGDVRAIETLVLSALGELVTAGARVLFFTGALFLLSWKLALAALLVLCVLRFPEPSPFIYFQF